MTSGSDSFGLSDSDEADLLKIETNLLKRKSENEPPAVTKKIRTEPSDSTSLITAKGILKKSFRLNAFRLQQEAAIVRLLDGKSSVVVFPTGGGKSLCYQLPALCFKEVDRQSGLRDPFESGLTVVVSPLIALMKDQVDTLKRLGISAAVLDSTKTREEYLNTVEGMRNGTLDILYCAPERLNNEGFVASIAHVRGGVRLLAVDEAHCISEWGHAFRPDYLKVARFAKEIRAERVVCLTATATAQVAEDVCHAFDVPEAEGLFRTTSYRPNLHLLARSFQTKEESYPELTSFLTAHPGPTIIYVTLQKQTEELAEKLRKRGFKARHFHAGMKLNEKVSCQDEFMVSKNAIIVATIAFGMGIDKANIRNVIHYDIPRSLEGYSQEIGRAGRDGLESHCMLYLCAEDLHLRESFARGDLPSKKSVAALLHKIFSSSVVVTATGPTIESNTYTQSKDFDIRPTVLSNIYAQLELRFELFRATTPKYTAYSYKTITSTNDDTSTAARVLRGSSRTAKVLTHVDVDAALRASTFTRVELVAKLNQWNDDGRIDLKAGGVMNIYRVLKVMPDNATQKQKIIDALYEELELREQQELARMKQVIDLVTGTSCFALTLAQHFGDALPDDRQGCGHCTWCLTSQPVERVSRAQKPWDAVAFSRILAACKERDDPRFLTRIAFGITSPRITSSKLSSQPIFGSMAEQDFMTLLRAFTAVCDKATGANPD